ncbi:MAG TPA: arylsulfotransferase family protein, partial [Pseudomonadales bacterium]|nr:arylsulfotransferase family protein [Pseudomonadales bacterium]
FVRQHDPDFIDGDTISVLDNNNVMLPGENAKSRVLIKNVVTDETKVAFEGTKERPFFTYVMGKHQWLPNGNLLISESTEGRALEINPKGETVWEFNNLVDQGWVAIMEEVERLPKEYDEAFFVNARARCEAEHKHK